MERDYLAEVRKAQVANSGPKATRMPFKLDFAEYPGLVEDVRKALLTVLSDDENLVSTVLVNFQECYRHLALLYFRQSLSPFLRGKKDIAFGELRVHVLAMARLFGADFIKYRQAVATTFSTEDVVRITEELFALGSADTLAPVIGKSPPKPFSQLVVHTRGLMSGALKPPVEVQVKAPKLEAAPKVKSPKPEAAPKVKAPKPEAAPKVKSPKPEAAPKVKAPKPTATTKVKASLKPAATVKAKTTDEGPSLAELKDMEAELARVARYFDTLPAFYEKQVHRIDLTAEEECALIIKAQAGDNSAMRKLYEANLRHVVFLANYFNKQSRGKARFELIDLAQQGNIGLVTGVRKFDPSKPIRLITYAAYYIKYEIREFVFGNNTEVPVPMRIQKRYKHLVRIEAELREKLDREPTETEIRAGYVLYQREKAEERALKKITAELKLVLNREPLKDEVETQYQIWLKDHPVKETKRTGRNYVTLSETRQAVHAPVFLDQPVDEDGMTPGQLVASTTTSAIDEVISRGPTGLKAVIAPYLNDGHSCLSSREKFLLNLRFGFNVEQGNGDGETLGTIGKKMNVSRERVRQLEAKALEKLRAQILRDHGDSLSEILENLYQIAS